MLKPPGRSFAMLGMTAGKKPNKKYFVILSVAKNLSAMLKPPGRSFAMLGMTAGKKPNKKYFVILSIAKNLFAIHNRSKDLRYARDDSGEKGPGSVKAA